MQAREIIDDYELEMEEYADDIDERLRADFAEYNRPFWHGADEWEDEVEDDPHDVLCGDLRPWEELDEITHPVAPDDPVHHAKAA